MPDSLALFRCLHPLVTVTTIRHFRLCYNHRMATSEHLLIDVDGKITLPETTRNRYALAQNMRLRIIETRNGILLVPLTDEPMSRALLSELEQWQSLGAESLEMFPYVDEQGDHRRSVLD